MAKITFETGQVVNFDGNPTPADIEEVAARLGVGKKQISKKLPPQAPSTAQTRQDEQISGRKGEIQGIKSQLENPRFSDESIREERKETIKGLPRLFGKKTETEKERDALEQKIDRKQLLNTGQTIFGTKGLNLTPLAEGVGRGLENIAGSLSKKFDSRSELLQQRNESQAQQLDSVIEQMQAARASGDMERYELLKQEMLIPLANESNLLASETDEFIDRDPSNKEIIGGAVSAATLAASGGLSAGGASLTTRFLPSLAKPATTFLGGVAQGAIKTGAVGLSGGALEGVGRGITQEKDIKGVIGQSLKEGAIGGIGGVITGGVLGGITTKMRLDEAQRQVNKNVLESLGTSKKEMNIMEDAIDTAMAPNTKSNRELAIREGRIRELSNGTEVVVPTKKELEAARIISNIVEEGDSISAKTGKMQEAISTRAKTIESALATNNTPFDGERMASELAELSKDNRLLFAGDAAAERAYNTTVEAFIEESSEATTRLELFKARQKFDASVNYALRGKAFDDPAGNVMRTAVRDVRDIATEIALEGVDDGAIKTLMREEHLIYNSLDNFAANAQKELGKSGFDKLYANTIKKLPFGVRVGLSSGAAGGLGGFGLSKILGNQNG